MSPKSKTPNAAAASPGQAVKISAAKGRPMLTWVGKRPLTQVTAFPAQHVETFDPTAELASPKGDGWKDWPEAYPPGGLLFHGDNKEVLAHLAANGFRGKVDLIYIDPPFDSGADYVRRVSLRGPKGAAKLDGEGYSLGEQIQYTDIWANDEYLQFMYERLLLLRELLASEGTFYIHGDIKRIHHFRAMCDEIFGPEALRNEIVWFYDNKLGTGGATFDSRHDTLLVYTKGRRWAHNPVLLDVKERKKQPVTQKVEGKRVWLRDAEDKRIYQMSEGQRPVGDVWAIPIINPVASERVDYPTQKPRPLLERIVFASSRPGDIVLDAFVGSGTTAEVAQKLSRRWIGCDINKGAIQTTAKRLVSVIEDQARATGQSALSGTGDDPSSQPAQLAFTTWRVNDYDLAIQHNEAVNLACQHLGVERTHTDAFFDGVLGKRLVKIVPFDHPLTPVDLEELGREMDARPQEDRDVVMVSLGVELGAQAWVEDWNRLRRGRNAVNRIEVVELRSDPKYGKFFAHEPARAKVKIERDGDLIRVQILDFVSPTIVERLAQQTGIVKPQIEDWRSMVDCVMFDTGYDGEVFNVALTDVPGHKTDLIEGTYEMLAPPSETRVAVKIIDMLGEELIETALI